jgi:hypothetical protein
MEQHGINSINEAVERLRNTIARHGTLEFIQELWYHELIRSTSYDVLDEDTGLPPKMVEYLYGLATTVSQDDQTSSSIGFYDVIDSLSLVYDKLRLEQLEVLAQADSEEERRQAHVQHSQLERELTTGRFAHGRQRREFARRVYSRVDDELSDILGFSASEAVSLADGISNYHETKLSDDQLIPIVAHVLDIGEGPFQVQSPEVIAKAREDPAAAFPSVWVNVAKYDNHRVNPLGSDYETDEHSHHEGSFGTIRTAGPELGFTPSDVREVSEREFSKLDTFLDVLSIGFGEYNSDLSDTSGSFRKFDYPFDHNPLHKYPFIRDRSGRFYLGPQNALWYTLSTRFRYDILGSEYEGAGTRKIGVGIEDWVEECLENVDDETAVILSNVDYDFQDGESDFVLLYEDTIIVIEVKTRGLRLDSRLGPFGSFKQIQEDVEEIIGEPYNDQALKLINGIKNGDVTELQTENETIEIDSSRFSEYVPIVVLSQPLDFVGTVLYADLLEFQAESPYITDVYSLQTICRNLSGSHNFLEYIKRRIQVGMTGKAFSIDEIDYLGAYLDHGLEYPDIPRNGMVEIFHVGSHLEREYGTGITEDMEHL